MDVTLTVPPVREGVAVRAVDLAARAEVSRFVELPFQLYRDVPQWTPPLRRDVERQLDPARNAYFRHSQAGFFVAERAGVVVGRIAALRHRFYNEKHQNDTVFFHWFECVDDLAVSAALFATAETWARARGARRMLGPIGFIQPEPPGILVEGFEHEATMNVPWHFPYYERHITAAGFQPHTDYVSGYLDRSLPYPEELVARGEAAMQRRGYTARRFRDRREMEAWLGRFYTTYLEAFADVPDFYPLSPPEFAALSRDLLDLAEPATIQLLLREEEVIGFLLAFRDVTPGLRRARGSLWPLGWWHLLRSLQRSRQCNIIALGVLPQHQKGGANLALLATLISTLHASRFQRAEIVQIVRTNLNTHGDMSRLGARWHKVHRVFRREWTPGEGNA